MGRKYYVIENGKIVEDKFAYMGFSSLEEAKLYLDWVVNFNKQEEGMDYIDLLDAQIKDYEKRSYENFNAEWNKALEGELNND